MFPKEVLREEGAASVREIEMRDLVFEGDVDGLKNYLEEKVSAIQESTDGGHVLSGLSVAQFGRLFEIVVPRKRDKEEEFARMLWPLMPTGELVAIMRTMCTEEGSADLGARHCSLFLHFLSLSKEIGKASAQVPGSYSAKERCYDGMAYTVISWLSERGEKALSDDLDSIWEAVNAAGADSMMGKAISQALAKSLSTSSAWVFGDYATRYLIPYMGVEVVLCAMGAPSLSEHVIAALCRALITLGGFDRTMEIPPGDSNSYLAHMLVHSPTQVLRSIVLPHMRSKHWSFIFANMPCLLHNAAKGTPARAMLLFEATPQRFKICRDPDARSLSATLKAHQEAPHLQKLVAMLV